MAKAVSFPLSLGRRDSVDPKLAPLGVLATCKNLRVRKDGRLGCRNGYLQQSMAAASALVVHDLHTYRGRILALGSDDLSGCPTRTFEYSTAATAPSRPWRYETQTQELTPFVDLKDISVMSPPSSGADMVDSAAGGGYVCVVTRSVDLAVTAVVVRESDNQPILTEVISLTQSTNNFRVTFAVNTFYVASQRSNNQVDFLSFRPDVDAAFIVLLSAALASSATAALFDFVPVENPTTARIALVRDRGTTATSLIRVYSSAGAQIGSDITYGAAGDDTAAISLSVDQTANKIHVCNYYAGGTGELRTFNFAGTLLLGPTATTAGTHASICRIPPTAAAGAAAQVAVAAATSTGATVIQYFSEAAHAATASTTISCAVITTRVIPWVVAASTGANSKYAVVFGGYVSPVISSTTDATNALFYTASGIGNAAHMATRDFLNSLPGTYRNVGLHLDSSTQRVTWCAMRDGGSGSAQPAITTFPKHSSARRQSATFGNLLYIASAPMQVYDGRCLTEPFQEVPGIVSLTPSNGAGTLTSLATYTYVVHWELTLADGSFWQSAPSSPVSVTMGAADDTVTAVVSTPHLLTTLISGLGYGPEVVAVLSRTSFSGAVEGSTFRKANTKNVTGTGGSYGATSSIVDTTPDATLDTREALYTQSERGALSGVLEHDAPRSSSFVTASESRLYLAGQLATNQFQVSKEAFLGEPFTFSEFSTFFGQVSGALKGIFSLDGARMLFTTNEIFAVFGGGPDDLGGGQLEFPIRIPSPSGLEDWRSFLEDPTGLYFQLDDAKLYQMPRGGGAPVWVGVDVQDTLALYPVITGACKSKRDDCALFTCQNTAAGTDARIIVRSLRTGLWMEDTPPLTASEGIEAITAYGDTVAYVTGGAMYVQSATTFEDVSSTPIVTQTKTNPLYPFGVGGTGLIHDLMVVGEWRSSGTLALRVSYDDGVSFTSLGSFVLTSGYTVGETIKRRWALPVVGAKSLIAEWTYTPNVSGEGFICNSGTMLVTADEGLPELDPDEML
mgnify:CR=1 FL=1